LIRISLSMFISGFLFGSGPCLAGCGPLLVSYIAGTGKNIPQAAAFYSLFSLSRIAVYLVLSLTIYFLGNISQEYLYPGFAPVFGGIFIVLCGLVIISGKRLDFPFFKRFNKIIAQRDIENPVIFGLIYGLIPCAPFLSVFSYSGLISHNWSEALAYSFCFGLGTFLSPLLAVSVFSGTLAGFLKGAGEKYLYVLRVLCGLILIFMGIQLARKGF
jgi:sulfite exporter TauE/SafE